MHGAVAVIPQSLVLGAKLFHKLPCRAILQLVTCNLHQLSHCTLNVRTDKQGWDFKYLVLNSDIMLPSTSYALFFERPRSVFQLVPRRKFPEALRGARYNACREETRPGALRLRMQTYTFRCIALGDLTYPMSNTGRPGRQEATLFQGGGCALCRSTSLSRH